MNKEQKKKLEEIIKRGKWNYVFINGIIYFGGLMFLFMIVWSKFIMDYEIDNFMILQNFIIWFIAGLIFGLWTWRGINKRFKESQ